MCKWSRREVELAAGLGAVLGALDDCFEGADDPRNQDRNADILVFRDWWDPALDYRVCMCPVGMCTVTGSRWNWVLHVTEDGKRVGAWGIGTGWPGRQAKDRMEIRDHLYTGCRRRHDLLVLKISAIKPAFLFRHRPRGKKVKMTEKSRPRSDRLRKIRPKAKTSIYTGVPASPVKPDLRRLLQARAKTANKETWGSGVYACLALALTGLLTGSGAAAQAEWADRCPGGRGGDLRCDSSAVQLVQVFSAGPELESFEGSAVAIGRSAQHRPYCERADAREPGGKVGFQLVTEGIPMRGRRCVERYGMSARRCVEV